jgi:hypothetical protein
MRFYKRLNWGAFIFMLVFTLLGAISRKDDTDLQNSFELWFCLGIPCAIIFLFVGMDSKDDQNE